MSFDPLPKRERILKDGTMTLRSLPMTLQSAPYDRANISPESFVMKMALQEMLEQADGDDYADYED